MHACAGPHRFNPSIFDVLRSTTRTESLQWVTLWSGGRGMWWEPRLHMWACSAASRTWTLTTLTTPATQEVSLSYCLCPAMLTLFTTAVTEGQTACSSLRPVCVCLCVCGDWLHTDLTVTFPSPQVLWSWRSGTTWSWWSLAPRPACPWPETPPSWALSSSLKVCHVTGDPRDAFAKRTVQQGAVVVTSTDFGCCEKNTGSSRVCTGWTTDWVSFSLRGL